MEKKAFELDGEKFISKPEILLKVSPNTYRNGTSLYRLQKSKHWACSQVNGQEFIAWSTLTKQVQEKIGNIDDLIHQSSTQANKFTDPGTYTSEIELILEFSFHQKRIYEKYFSFYNDRYFYPGEIELYARMHALIKSILVLKEQGYELKKIYEVVFVLQGKLKFYNFKVGSYNYFSEKLIFLQEVGIEFGIIHGNKHIPKEDKLLVPYVEKQIIKFYIQNKPRLKYKDITDKVNHELGKRGFVEISLSLVKKFLRQTEIQNLYKPIRLGKAWAEKFLDPFFVRAHPKDANDKWEMDGTVLPFYFLWNGVITRFWYSIMVDVHSRKIISWAVGRYETRYLVLEVYRLAIVFAHALAFEIVRDNAGAYDTKEVVDLETKLEDHDCLVRPASPDNPKDKGTVEKVHDILNCDHFSKYADYFIGEPWNSDRELYRMEPVEIKELRKIKNIMPAAMATQIMGEVVAAYNSRVF